MSAYNSRKSASLTDRRLRFLRFREYLGPIAAGGAVLGTVAGLILLNFGARIHIDALGVQARSTPPLYGTAKVTNLTSFYRKGGSYAQIVMSLNLNGALVEVHGTAALADKLARTRVGDTVAVTYHRIPGVIAVVDDWEPPARKADIGR